MKTLFEQLSDTISGFIDEYADKALDIIDDDEKEQLKSSPEEGLVFYHFTLGMYLRSKLNIWTETNRLLPLLQEEFLHPEEVSSMIIYRMWQKLNQEP